MLGEGEPKKYFVYVEVQLYAFTPSEAGTAVSNTLSPPGFNFEITEIEDEYGNEVG